MIQAVSKGDFKNTLAFLKKVRKMDFTSVLKRYGQIGVDALAAATPKRTGKTAESWYYEIRKRHGEVAIYWANSNLNDNVPIAVILDYGHGTGEGGYVEGRNYIKPAIRPVFDEIAKAAWREVTE